MSTQRLLATALALSLLAAAVGCASNAAVNDGGSGGSSGGSAGSGGGTADGPGTFPCGTANCASGREYCFTEEWDGTQKVQPECRALPAGCSTCACAQSVAESVSLSCQAAGTLTCITGGVVIDYNTSSPTLTLGCLVP